MPFIPGQRVRYTGKHTPGNKWWVGWEGEVIKDMGANTEVKWDNVKEKEFGQWWVHYTDNLELVIDDDPLNASIRAYVDEEKRSMGLA